MSSFFFMEIKAGRERAAQMKCPGDTSSARGFCAEKRALLSPLKRKRQLLPSFSYCFTSLSRYAGWIGYHDRTNEIGKKPTHGRAENGKKDPKQADYRGINIQIFGNATANAIPLFVGLRFIKLFLHKDLPSRGSPHCHSRIVLKRREKLAPFVF